ncbi:Uncharacterized protein TCM_014534 [Theobroma cacao]|uniref:Uncharacterized protein n=1 Tax=Theobroma cacao TaxID=3641 RepID=A0A061G5L0_THECC|nr:Uncharacterized protein TCM_014534 [Theobroma cacao]
MQQRQLQQGVDDGYCGPQLVIPSIRQSCNAVRFRSLNVSAKICWGVPCLYFVFKTSLEIATCLHLFRRKRLLILSCGQNLIQENISIILLQV